MYIYIYYITLHYIILHYIILYYIIMILHYIISLLYYIISLYILYYITCIILCVCMYMVWRMNVTSSLNYIVISIWIYLLCSFRYHFTFNIFQLSMCSDVFDICACGRPRLMQHQSLSWWIRPGGSNDVQQIVPFWRLGLAAALGLAIESSGFQFWRQAAKSHAKELHGSRNMFQMVSTYFNVFNLSWDRTMHCGRHPLPCHHERCTSCTVRTLLISREGLGI